MTDPSRWWECPRCALVTLTQPARNAKCQCGSRAVAMLRCPCGAATRIGRLNVSFCSRTCAMQFTPGRRKGGKFPNEQRAATVVCETCATPFRAVKSTKSRPARFCGISCYMKSTAETTIEAAVRRWLEANGIAYIAQHNIGRYHVDFYVPDSGTVIEADGDYWHAIPRVAAKDARKEAWLVAQGYEVIRLAEHEIRAGVDDVIRRRWTRWARENGRDPGPGALEARDG